MLFCKWSRQQAGQCNLKTYYELAAFWRNLPPAEVQLANIASALGIKQQSLSDSRASPAARASSAQTKKQSDDEIAMGIRESGMQVFEGPLPAHLAALLDDLPLT